MESPNRTASTICKQSAKQTERKPTARNSRIIQAIRQDGAIEPLTGLHFNRISSPSQPYHVVSIPAFCVIAQCSKAVLLGNHRYQYDPMHYLLATVEQPIVTRILEASQEKPYLSLRLDLDPALVGSVIVEAGHTSSRNGCRCERDRCQSLRCKSVGCGSATRSTARFSN